MILSSSISAIALRARQQCIWILVISLVLLLSSCATARLNPRERQIIGNTALIYVPQVENVTYPIILSDGHISYFGLFRKETQNEYYHPHNIRNRKLFEPYKQEISYLPFNDAMHQMVTDVIAQTPWLNGLPIKTVNSLQVNQDVASLLKGNTTSAMVFEPFILLDTIDTQDAMIGMHINVMKRDPRYQSDIYEAFNQSFSRNNAYKVDESGMSWAQKKATTHAIVAMTPSQNMAVWFADDAQKLRVAFNADLPIIKKEMIVYFKDPNSRKK